MHANGNVNGNNGGCSEAMKDTDDKLLPASHRQQESNGGGVIAVRNKRVYFDVETKMHTLNRIENGEAKSAIIREMRLPPSTLATWIKDRERIAELYRHSMGTRKRLRRGGGGGGKSPAPTTIDVDPSTSAHLGGPFVTPSASDEATIGGEAEDDNESKEDVDDVTPGDEGDDMESTETEVDEGAIEQDEEALHAAPPQLLQQPQLQHQQSTLSTSSAGGATIAIPLLRRAPQMVLPRPLIPRTTVSQNQCQQFQQQQQQQQQPQQQQQASVTLRPTLSTANHLPPTAAVSLGAFLTAAPQTPQHHGLLLQQQQQQQLQQQHQQEQPISKSMLEDLFQRYTAQLSAILTFTISPIHSSLEQLNRRLTQLQSDQSECSQRLSNSSRNCDWLEHTKQHPTEPDKVLVAADTNYQMAIPLSWIRDCCDEAYGNGPEKTLSSLLLRSVGKQRLRQLLALGPTALCEDSAFKALRHYVALTQGPVSAQRMCARRDEILNQIGGELFGDNGTDLEGASA